MYYKMVTEAECENPILCKIIKIYLPLKYRNCLWSL